MKEILFILFAYLIGSIPTALIVSRYFFGIDIREYGSGNMGATNTFRVLGSKFGTIVMAGDILKGILAVALYNFIPYYLTNEIDRTNLMIGLGLAAVVGHIYPIWAQFRGGKGVATLFGMLLAMQPVVAVSCVGVFLLVLFLTRYVSFFSVAANKTGISGRRNSPFCFSHFPAPWCDSIGYIAKSLWPLPSMFMAVGF